MNNEQKEERSQDRDGSDKAIESKFARSRGERREKTGAASEPASRNPLTSEIIGRPPAIDFENWETKTFY